MAEAARFFDGVLYTEAQFAEVSNRYLPEGIIRNISSQLAVSAPGGMIVRVAPGEAMVQGFWYQLDANLDLAIAANSSGSTRTDSVVLRLNRVSNTVVLAIAQNTTTPNRTVGGNWELLIATVAVPNGAGAISAGNITDTRFGTTCGFTGNGSISAGTSLSNVGVYPPGDPDTGLYWPSADVLQLVAGATPGIQLSNNAVTIGNHASTLAVNIGRTGGTVNTFGWWQFPIGTTANPSLTCGGDTNTGVNFLGGDIIQHVNGGVVSHYFGPSTYSAGTGVAPSGSSYQWHAGWMYASVADGTAMQFVLGNNAVFASATKQGFLGLGTAGSQFLGGSGDLNLYTSGSAAGRLLLGTNSVLRVMVETNGNVTVGSTSGSARLGIMQASNTLASGLRIYNTNTSFYFDIFNDANGNGQFFTVGSSIPAFTLQNTTAKVAIGTASDFTGRLTIVQAGSTTNDGIYMVFGGGQGRLFVDANGWANLRSAGTSVALQHAAAVFCPAADQGAALGDASFRWSNLRVMTMTVNGAAAFGGALTGITSLAMAGALSGVTTIGHAGNITPGTTNAYDLGSTTFRYNKVWTRDFDSSNSLVAQTATFNGAVVINAGARLIGSFDPFTDSNYSVGQPTAMWGAMYTYNAFKPGGGSWTATSDDRAKMDDFRPFTDGLETILKLRPVLYRYNGLYGTPEGAEYVGFRAQELQQIVPEMVGTMLARRTGADDEEHEEILTVDTTRLEYMLLNAVTELATQVADLRARLDERKN